MDISNESNGTNGKAAAATSLVGHVIAGYRLVRVLEAEEASATLLGQHVEAPDQQAAIKILHVPAGTPAASLVALRAQFNREAQALFALQHPHLLGIYALGVDVVTGNPYMVLPYPHGGTLAERLATGALPLSTAAEYLAQMADALDTAHALGMIHGDLTPAHILFDGVDHLYVTGFGPSAFVSEKYVAPERLRGQAADPASDRYSLGVVLYEMVTGYAPFQGATPNIVALQHEHLPPPPPRALRPELPEQAEAVLLRALAKQPTERFASATALAEAFALGLGIESTPSNTVAPPPVVPPSLPQPQPQPQPVVAPHPPLYSPATPAAAAHPPMAPQPSASGTAATFAPTQAAPASMPASMSPNSPTITPPPSAHAPESAVPAAQPARVGPMSPPIAPPAASVSQSAAPPAVSPAPAPAPNLAQAPAASVPSAASAPSLPAIVPVRTAPNSAPNPVPGLSSNTATSRAPMVATPATQPTSESRVLAASARSNPAKKYLVPPVFIRNVMLAIFALALGSAIIAAMHVLGGVELLLAVVVIALFIYCGVILPGQAMKQEQRRAARASAAQAMGAGEQPIMAGATAS